MSNITVFCESCGKEISEKEAKSFYEKDNYLIICDECFNNEVNNDSN